MSMANTLGNAYQPDPHSIRARQQLLDILAESIESGDYDAVLATVPDAELTDLADRMLAGLPTKHPLDERIGPFYDTAGLSAWLNISRQAIHKQMRHGRILGVKTSDNAVLYPTFQFDSHGAVLPGLDDVLQLLDPERHDPWGSALWLTSPAKALDGDSPAQRMRANRCAEVLAIARRISAAEQVG